MLLNNIVILVGVVLESVAVHPIMFILGRFIVGINSGNTVSWTAAHWSVVLS